MAFMLPRFEGKEAEEAIGGLLWFALIGIIAVWVVALGGLYLVVMKGGWWLGLGGFIVGWAVRGLLQWRLKG